MSVQPHTATVERISTIFAERLHVEVPDATADLLDGGHLDSLTLVELLVQLEDAFGIEVRMEDLELDHLRSLQQIAGFVDERLPTAAAAAAVAASPVIRMDSPIRPLVERDIGAVSDLHCRVFGVRLEEPGATRAHANYFREVFLERAHTDLRSLVYQAEGRIVAFLGVHPVSLQMGSRSLRGAVSTQFVAEPDRGAEAAQVLSTFLGGPQDLSIADESNLEGRRLWERLGGTAPYPYALRWVVPLRPVELALDWLERRPHLSALRGLEPLARSLDGLAGRLGPRYLHHHPAEGTRSSLAPATVLEHAGDVWPEDTLRPARSYETLCWLLGRLRARADMGHLHASTVHTGEGTVGWYVVLAPPHGVAEVVQLAARPGREAVVLDHLLEEMAEAEATAAAGRLEPRFLSAITDRYGLFHARGAPLLVHTQDPEVAAAFREGRAGLSRLEGELPLRFKPV